MVAFRLPAKAIINDKNKITTLIELQPSTIGTAYTSPTKKIIDNSSLLCWILVGYPSSRATYSVCCATVLVIGEQEKTGDFCCVCFI